MVLRVEEFVTQQYLSLALEQDDEANTRVIVIRSITSVDFSEGNKEKMKASSDLKLLSESAEKQDSAGRHDLWFT